MIVLYDLRHRQLIDSSLPTNRHVRMSAQIKLDQVIITWRHTFKTFASQMGYIFSGRIETQC
jgi:hypothetical protein